MTDDELTMLARADNIRDGSVERFAQDLWRTAETDYARKLIADLAAALRARDTEVRELKATVSQLYEQIEMLHDRVAR